MTAIPPYRIALVLGGGAALGSWQAGAFEAFTERGFAAGRVSGASTGAINGAIIAGNPPERAVERLRAYWSPADPGIAGWWPAEWDAWRRSTAVTAALTLGQPEIFGPRPFLGQPWAYASGESPSLFDTRPLLATMADAVDWDRIASGPTRLSVTAVELDSGEDAVFDSATTRLTPEHVRASSALMPAFPPVEIDGRWYVDPGLSANLPLDGVLAEPGGEPLLAISLDLLPLSSPRPRTIGESAARLQDIVFAAQTRRTIDAWKTVYDLHGPAAPSVTLARLSYGDQEREVAGKAFDFSPETAAERWASGRAAMTAFLDELEAGQVTVGAPGLTVYRDVAEAKLAAGTFRLKPSEKAG